MFYFFNIKINKTKSKPNFSIDFFLYSHVQFAKSGNKHTWPLSCEDQNLNVMVYYESEVTQSCQTLCDPMDCSLPHSYVYEIFQARILEWVVISFSRESSQGSNPGLPHCRQPLYCLSHQRSPIIL